MAKQCTKICYANITSKEYMNQRMKVPCRIQE